MEKITINTAGCSSEILVGQRWESVSSLLPADGVVIITDDNVNRLYGPAFPEAPVFSVIPGEESKRLEVIESLAENLLNESIDRSGFILAVGGGVVCDIAGFLASIYMRGIRCGYVSTTLLSQVDASTGGKNGVNLGGIKNMLGVIRQPEFVICDPIMLQTLSEPEYLSGLAELIKTAIIGDKDLFALIENRFEKVLLRNDDLLTEMVLRSVRFKGYIVSEDEKESGLRRILNFGHTFGHAIEMQRGVRHGFAVASGMEIATLFSYEKGYISLEEKERIINLLKKFKLIEKLDLEDDQVKRLLLNDKKKTGKDIHFVFTGGIGKAKVEKVQVNDLINFYKKYRDKI